MQESYGSSLEGENKISDVEKGIINDIRRLNFGKVIISIQNGAVILKEIVNTVKIKNNKS